MNAFKNGFACLTLALALSACDEGKGPGNPDAYQGKDGVTGSECTQAFLDQYNEVALSGQQVQADLELNDTTTNQSQTRKDAEALRDKASALKTKYANVSCLAKNKKGEKESLDVNQRMDTAIQAANAVLTSLDRQGAGSTSRVTPPASTAQQCSSTFLTDYSTVTDLAKTVGDELDQTDTPANRERTKADAQKLKDRAKVFQIRFAGYKCDVSTGSSRYSIDVDAKMNELATTAEKVIELLNSSAPAQGASALFAPAEQASPAPMELITN